MIDITKYRNYAGTPLDEKDFYGVSYTVIDVLQFLWDQPMNDIAMAYITGLKPTYLVINSGEIATDARPGRVHVSIDKEGKIKGIRQEISISLPDGIDHGYDLSVQLDKQKKGEEYKKETEQKMIDAGFFYCPYIPPDL